MVKIKKFVKNLSNIQKFVLFTLITLFLIILSISIPTLANLKNNNGEILTSTWDGTVATSYKSGNGSQNNPFIISSASEFVYFLEELKNTDYNEKYFSLTTSIILNDGILNYSETNSLEYIKDGITYYVENYGYNYYDNVSRTGIPAGQINMFLPVNNFKGNFDGNLNTIYGLYIANNTLEEIALFANLEGTLNNFDIRNAFIMGGTKTAGIAAIANNSTLNTVSFNGTVIGKNDEKKVNINLDNKEIFAYYYDTANYLELPESLQNIPHDIVSVKLSGKCINENGTSVKINEEVIIDEDFEIDFGKEVLFQVPVITKSSTSNPELVKFENIKYTIVYKNTITAGITAYASETTIHNTINKGNVYGSSITSGIIGSVNGTFNINRSYNSGTINSPYLGSGIIGVVEESTTNINKVYNTGIIKSINKAGFIGLNNPNKSNIQINNSFNTGNVDYISQNNLTVNNSYYSGNVTKPNNFQLIAEISFQTTNFLQNTLLFNEYTGLDFISDENVWVYKYKDFPALYSDDSLEKVATIHSGSYSFDTFHTQLEKILFKKNITFSIEKTNILKKIKETYYYISTSLTPLSIEELDTITWIPYENIEQITEDGNYVVYAKLIEYDGSINYINTNLLILDSEGPLSTISMDNGTWNSFIEEPQDIYLNRQKELLIEATDTLSELKSLEYHISNTKLSKTDLEALSSEQWTTYTEEISLVESGNYIIYVKAVDNSDNVTYINSDNLILDWYLLDDFKIGKNNTDYNSYNITSNSSIALNFRYEGTSVTKEGSTHNLISNILLPKGTKITLIDNITNKIYVYKITTDEDIYGYEDNCENSECKAIYPFNLFKEIGTINNGNFIETQIINESFTIILDFLEATVSHNYTDVMLYMSLFNDDINIRPTLYDSIIKFNIYSKINGELANAILSVTSNSINETIVINSNSTTDIDLTTMLSYKNLDGTKIVDTTFENQKTELIIKLIDKNNNIVDRKKYKNIIFKIGDKTYSPNINNIIKIPMSNTMDLATKNLTIITHANNDTLEEGTYSFEISSYSSYDRETVVKNGTKINIPATIINDNPYIFHIFSVTTDNPPIINKTSIENEMLFNIKQQGYFGNPHIRISLYEKSELTAFNQEYSPVDLNEYLTNSLNDCLNNTCYIHLNRNQEIDLSLNFLTEKLRNTGYRIIFELYDGLRKIETIRKNFIVR